MTANKKSKGNSPQPITTRLSISDRAALLAEAERRGTTAADMLRISWTAYQEQQKLDERIRSLETRLKRQMFEIVCAVGGLTPSERNEALQDVRRRLQEIRS